MRNLFFVLSFVLFIIGCGPSKKTTSGNQTTNTNTSTSTHDAAERDGSSFEKAIVINEKTESKGVRAEYDWLDKNYPGYKFNSQSLAHHDGKAYDVLHVTLKGGGVRSFYFDISNFFGKF